MKSLTRLLFVLIPLGLILAWAVPAMGQAMICGDRSEILANLKKGYDEQVVGMGVTQRGAVVERLEAPKGQTWTIIVTTPDGLTCFVAAGQSWEAMPVIRGPES